MTSMTNIFLMIYCFLHLKHFPCPSKGGSAVIATLLYIIALNCYSRVLSKEAAMRLMDYENNEVNYLDREF